MADDPTMEERARRERARVAWEQIETKAAEDPPKAAVARLLWAIAVCLLDLRRRPR